MELLLLSLLGTTALSSLMGLSIGSLLEWGSRVTPGFPAPTAFPDIIEGVLIRHDTTPLLTGPCRWPAASVPPSTERR